LPDNVYLGILPITSRKPHFNSRSSRRNIKCDGTSYREHTVPIYPIPIPVEYLVKVYMIYVARIG